MKRIFQIEDMRLIAIAKTTDNVWRLTVRNQKLQDVIAFANEHELQCVSTKYSNCDTALHFVCKNNHNWKLGIRALKKALNQGRHCTHCGSNAHKITKNNAKNNENSPSQ